MIDASASPSAPCSWGFLRLPWSYAVLLVRIPLVAVAVGVCYLFQWNWLRHLTQLSNVRLNLLAGLESWPAGSYYAFTGHHFVRYVIACTFADAWCGAGPTWHARLQAATLLARRAAVVRTRRDGREARSWRLVRKPAPPSAAGLPIAILSIARDA